MTTPSSIRSAASLVATAAGVSAGAYGLYAALTWLRYGRPSTAHGHPSDELLDGFMPVYEVVERHHIEVAAPAAVTLLAAREQHLFEPWPIRAIFRARELALGTEPGEQPLPRGLMATVQALGWGVLAELPDREVVVGAVTQPWEANVTFHALPAGEFAAFSAPGFVKIAWTLRADPRDDGTSLFRTETRAVATDPDARAKFRRYWAFVSPGIALIRRLSLRPLKRDAERRARTAQPAGARAW